MRQRTILSTTVCALCGLFVLDGGDARLEANDSPIIFELSPESTFAQGCVPPCLCPILLTEGVRGTLRLDFVDSDPLFERYDVSDVRWLVPGDPPRRVTGSGTYRIGGEVELMQQLVLDLQIGDEPAQAFDSGPVVGGQGFPERLEITVPTPTECMATIFGIKAQRAREFLRGDCNADASRNIADPVAALLAFFAGKQVPCHDACDVDDDGELAVADAIWLLEYLFLSGAAPAPPFPGCGVDPTADTVGCEKFAPCSGGCDAAIEAIAAETSIVGSCSAVVRLDHESREIVGWQLICGEYSQVTESSAREQAQADAGYGARPARMLNAEKPEDAYIFYVSPGDFGGASVISARTGRTVFGGSIIWVGRGEITYPKEWRAPEDAGADCAPLAAEIPSVGYDLLGGERLDPDVVEELLDVVWSTAIPAGLATSGYLFDAVVLRYPRSVGGFDPSSAEWIVVVNAGWLE